ncbi:MAG: hypothetical protein AAEJ04_07805 [Planctomycetota bacterium]
MSRIVILLLFLSVLFAGSFIAGHDGVHVDVDRVNKELETSTNPGPLYLLRAKLCRAHGRPDLGLQDLQMARGCGIDMFEEKLERAMCLRDTLKIQQALQLLDELAEAPGNPALAVFSERSALRETLGDIDGAIIDLARVHAVRPDLEKTLRLGLLYEKRKAPRIAASLYRKMIEKNGASALLTISLIRAETDSERFDAALILVEEKLLEASLKAPWLQRKAEILRTAGREGEAISVLNQALKELDSIFRRRPVPIHRVTRARILRQLGRFEEAKSELETVLEQAPGYETAKSELGLVLELLAEKSSDDKNSADR